MNNEQGRNAPQLQRTLGIFRRLALGAKPAFGAFQTLLLLELTQALVQVGAALEKKIWNFLEFFRIFRNLKNKKPFREWATTGT